MRQSMMSNEEAWKFRLGADIYASDGTAGKLVAVVTDGPRQYLTHVGVRVHRFRRSYFVPVDLVTTADADSVTLSIALDEVETRSSTPQGAVLSRSTRVNSVDTGVKADTSGKRLGHLVQITVDRETCALRDLVVDRGGRGEVLVPGHTIASITSQQLKVQLAVSPESLVQYRPDGELRQALHDRLEAYAPLRLDLAAIEIRPIDGVVHLRGHVSSDLLRRMAEDQLQGATGVAELYNDLVADTDLANSVSMALALDMRTAGQHIGVYPRLGEIYLRGSVGTDAAFDGASAVARAVPAVTRVVNELRINPNADEIPVLAGVTNHEDMVPGGR
jgi:osmotically-inducible protein OsmY